MDKKIISLLACPFCGSRFSVDAIFRASPQENIRFGILRCSCDYFPIVEGILFLKKRDESVSKHQRAAQLLRKNKYQEAVNLLFDEKRRAKVPYALLLLGLLGKLTMSHFLKVVKFFIPESGLWFKHMSERERRPTFFLSLMNLAYMEQKQVAIDIGCSVGWFFKYAMIHSSNSIFIGVESSFSALYLARKYVLKKQGNLICADVDLGLPFQSGVIDRIFVNDVFMYLKRKNYFLQEARRVGKNNVLLFLSHVHSDLNENIGQGHGLTTQELKTYNHQYQMWGASDELLFLSLIKRDIHPYRRLKKDTKVLSSPSCSLVISKNRLFTPRVTPNWIHQQLQKTSLNFVEDPQFNL